MDDEIPSPAGIALIGAIAVVIFYWLHLAALGIGIDEKGVGITIFIAQYIPLAAVKNRFEEGM